MMLLNYATKKSMKEQIGTPLKYTETSMFGPEYKENGTFTGSNRPSINPRKQKDWREFFASVTVKDGLISKVE